MSIQLVNNGDSGLVARTKINDNFTELYTNLGGSVASVDVSGGATGLVTTGGPVTSSGTIVLGGILNTQSGGTGQSSFTNGQILIGRTDGTLAKATITAGLGISVTNGDGSVSIANTAPDQIVSLTAGSNVTITGAYPNFTIAAVGGGGSGTVTSVDVSGGTTGITFTGGPVTTSGTITMAGTLGVANGGTGQTSYTNGQLLIGNTTGGTLAKATLTAGTGISIANGAGSITITNAAPDQVVSLTGAGTTSISGTYPNFTITSNDQFVGTVTSVGGAGSVNGITLTGTVTSSGSLTLGGTLSNVSLTTQVTGTLPVANGGTGTATALTAGSVVFAGASGVYSQDNANLFWDDANNRLGIGTSAPERRLDVQGAGSITVRSRSTDTSGVTVGIVSAEHASGSQLQIRAGVGFTNLISAGAADPLILSTNSAERMRITNAGNVGIGTSSPGYKLSVSGTAELTAAKEGVFTVTDGATVNLDPNNGSIQTWTLGANRTPDQANWAAGQSITLMVDDGSAFTITWSTLAVVWETDGGTAPTLALTGFTVIVLWKVGTTIYGARVGDA